MVVPLREVTTIQQLHTGGRKLLQLLLKIGYKIII